MVVVVIIALLMLGVQSFLAYRSAPFGVSHVLPSQPQYFRILHAIYSIIWDTSVILL